MKAKAEKGLTASLEAFGDISGITFNEMTGELVTGHQRMKALRAIADREGVELKLEEVSPERSELVMPAHKGENNKVIPERRWPVRVVQMTRAEQIAASLTANNTAIQGDFTSDAELMAKEIAAWDAEMFNELSIDDVMSQIERDIAKDNDSKPDAPKPQIDRAAELQKEWQTEKGQIWEIPSKTCLGKSHRVMCGDCRVPEDVAQLLNGQKVNVAFTSPPYASQRKYDEESGFKPIKPDAYVEWFEAVQANVRTHLKQDGSWFMNIKEHCEDGQRDLYVNDLTIAHVRAWGWRFVDEFCWKRKGVPGRWEYRFKNEWEPVFHFSANDPKCNKYAVGVQSEQCFDVTSRKTKTTISVFDCNAENGKVMKSGLALPGNVVEINGQTESAHNAAFPVGLPTFFIKAFSDPSDLIFDPFLGSGTTMIAAEREGRIGIGMELSPKYVAVILQRCKDDGLEPRRPTAARPA